jgi:hypothetical protein
MEIPPCAACTRLTPPRSAQWSRGRVFAGDEMVEESVNGIDVRQSANPASSTRELPKKGMDWWAQNVCTLFRGEHIAILVEIITMYNIR